MEEVEYTSEVSNKDLYTGSKIVRQPPPTVSNVKQMCKEWTSNHVDWTKFLTAESKELNMSKTKFEDQLLRISSLYAMSNPLLWSKHLLQTKRIVLIRF